MTAVGIDVTINSGSTSKGIVEGVVAMCKRKRDIPLETFFDHPMSEAEKQQAHLALLR
jgi:hypothetical protein